MSVWLAATLSWAADEVVFDDALAQDWYDWSWTTASDFEATDRVHRGTTAMYGQVGPFGGLSVFRESGLATASAIRFWILADSPGLELRLEAWRADGPPVGVPLDPAPDRFTEVVVSLDELPPYAFDRISWVDTSGLGGAVWVDDVQLLQIDPTVRTWTGAELAPPRQLMLLGAGDPSTVVVTQAGSVVPLGAPTVAGGPSRTYLPLLEPLSAGTVTITTDDAVFERTVAMARADVDGQPTHTIADAVYGANFPDSAPPAQSLQRWGLGAVRWGGNARALYNPFTRVTNLAADYFFLNQPVPVQLDDWLGSLPADVPAVVTVPTLDWVADGTQYWQFSVAAYGAQQLTAPIEPDAGNGVLPDGSPLLGNDPSDASVPWTPTDVADWLPLLPHTPGWLAMGNETDIAHVTHRGVHPEPAGYVDQRDRFLAFAGAAKDVLPDVPVTGPVGCCWWFYWNAADGEADRAAHGDFLPWFLDEVAAADAASGRRTLDVLDLHYFPENLIAKGWKSATDPATNAWRLRVTRSLWDPDYVDESWVGSGDPVTDQPDPHAVQLIPRMRALLAEHYPGTKLGLSEWSFGAFEHPSGGLAAAEALGIFGREDLAFAAMWPAPSTGSYAAAAFELYREGALRFGNESLPVDVGALDPNRASVVAARRSDGAVSVVVVNKHGSEDLWLQLRGVDDDDVAARHFGGGVGARVVPDPTEAFAGSVVVPASSAVLLQLGAVGEPPSASTGDTGQGSDAAGGGGGGSSSSRGGRRCGCSSPGAPSVAWLLVFGVLSTRRRVAG
ncbi:MAG: glycoside hydrolase family 44 protein [Myxococcales bacterium]|nr:glycoside hydrolase family 44 protein [Myxococcales bacterium]